MRSRASFLPALDKLLNNPNINIPLRRFSVRWIRRRRSRLVTMESRSWKEKSSGWSRHFLPVIFAHGTGRFIPSFPPFSTEQRAGYRAYPPPGAGFVSSRFLLTDFFLNGWFAAPMRGETKGIRGWNPLVSTPFHQRLIPKGINSRCLFRACFNFFFF